jgi:NADPH-dependent curcumin reductase CurA
LWLGCCAEGLGVGVVV